MKYLIKLGLTVLIISPFVSSTGIAETVYVDRNITRDSDSDNRFADKMSNKRLDILIKRIDKNAEGELGYWSLKIDNQKILVITDEGADRMRIISPVINSEKLDLKQLTRIMQANFDSALDARYAIAKGVLWSAFIHPLSPLSDEEFIVGLGQVTNLISSFGGSYSSGLLTYRGGDSEGLRKRQLIDELLKKGLAI